MNAPFTLRTPPVAGRDRADILVWLVEFAAWRPHLPALRECLDPSQRARSAILRDPAQRRDRELVHALHRMALGEFLGLPASSVPLERSADGQPLLAGGEIHTSLSHARMHGAIAISTAGAVGVDIEPRLRNFSLAELAERICHPEERHSIDEAGLLRLWVRKEAALKAIGTGLSVEMATFVAPDGGLVSLRSGPSAAELTLRVRHVDAGVECVAAVAGAPDASIACRWLAPLGEPWRKRATEPSAAMEPIRN